MKNKHFTERERYILEHLLDEKWRIKDIADILGKSERAIYYEKKRGTIEMLDTHLRKYQVYKADYAQNDYAGKLHQKEHDLKVGSNIRFIRYIEEKVRRCHCSFYAALKLYEKEYGDTPVCEKTLYNYFRSGIFFNLRPEHLPYRKKNRKKNYDKRTVALHNLNKRSISDRPETVLQRKEYGHWEMDTVVSGKNKGRSTLLVLTERMTLEEIVLKMPDKKADSVVSALDALELRLGSESFRNTFRTITVDNGVEFMDCAGMEKGKRTVVYYCHPFCSCERGSNENQNKLIRRWCPKGTNIGSYDDAYIDKLNVWLNNYPRKKFGGLSSAEMLRPL